MTRWLWKKPRTGVWYAVWKERGQTRRRSLGTTRKREALQRLRVFRPTRRYTKAARVTMGLAAASWVEFKLKGRRRLTRSTTNLYRQLPTMLGDLAEIPCSALDAQDVERWCDGMELEGRSPHTIRRSVSLLASTIDWAAAYHPSWGFSCNAAKVVLKTIPRPRARRREPMPDQDFWAMLERMRSGAPHFADLADAVEVQWFSGLRCTEVARLRWDDIDLGEQRWIIRSPANKGGERALPMHPRVADILAGRRDRETPFPGEGTSSQRWKLWCRDDEPSRGLSRGGIRHSFISRLRAAGHLAEAKDLARHSSPAMTDHYTHPSESALCSALLSLLDAKDSRRVPRKRQGKSSGLFSRPL